MQSSAVERWLTRHFRPCRRHHYSQSSVYVKWALCIVIIYLLNLIIGLQYYVWPEKSFEDEYHLTMAHIDITLIDNNEERVLGPAKNILSETFLITNPDLCGRGDPETMLQPHVLILVKSAVENFDARQAIRMTWGNKEELERKHVRLGFVLGTNPHNISVEDESKQYRDIIQIDKIDFYYYNSYKMVMMLRWISNYCLSQSRRSPHTDLRNYVLFVDDDYLIDIDPLLSYLHTLDEDPDITTYERRTFITGYVYDGSRPRRFLNDRWYISMADYPYDRYPPYVTAGCFLMTRYNARLFYIASKYTRIFRFDDIYMGLLAYSMSTKLIGNNDRFSSYGSSHSVSTTNEKIDFLSRWKSLLFGETKGNSTQIICTHGYRGEDLLNIWNQRYKTSFTLPKIDR